MFSLPPPPSLPLSFLPLSLSFMFCSFKCNLHAAKLKCKDSQGSFINLDKSMHPRQQPRPPPSRQGTFHSQPSRKFPRLLPAQHGPAPTRATSAQLPATKLASSLLESHADAGAGAGAGAQLSGQLPPPPRLVPSPPGGWAAGCCLQGIPSCAQASACTSVSKFIQGDGGRGGRTPHRTRVSSSRAAARSLGHRGEAVGPVAPAEWFSGATVRCARPVLALRVPAAPCVARTRPGGRDTERPSHWEARGAVRAETPHWGPVVSKAAAAGDTNGRRDGHLSDLLSGSH